ncbi:MAG: ABC transporter ATP-binding protein [Desulfotomaculales bacterium]
MDPLLVVSRLTKAFNGVQVLHGVGFRVGAGEVLGLAGPNGTGKTTILNIICGLVRPDAGAVIFDGHDLTELPPHRIAGLGVGRTFQLPRPLRELTVFENVLVAVAAGRGRLRARDRAKAREILARVGLTDREQWPAGRLSSGAMRRLEVARALATCPRLLLLDEPFAALSIKEERELMALLKSINRQGLAMILVSHRRRILGQLAHRVLLTTAEGTFREGTPGELLAERELEV